MTVDQIGRALVRALAALGVADQAAPRDIAGATGGKWLADVELRDQPGAVVTVTVADGDDEAAMERALRGELRRALRMCPLCQRIGHVEKLRNAEGQQEACAVRCPACGDFEIDQALIRDLRTAWERGDRGVLERLPAVSTATRRRQGEGPRLTSENWRSLG